MATTATLTRTGIESEGSEKKVYANLTVTGTYVAATGVTFDISSLGLNGINSIITEPYFSTYVIKNSISTSKKTVTLRLYNSSLTTGEGPQLAYNASQTATPASTVYLYYTPLAGNFVVGEVVTGGTSAATGTVVSISIDIYGNSRLEIGAPSAGAMVAAETITGGTSGATGTTLDEYHNIFDISGALATSDIVDVDDGGGFAQAPKINSFSPVIVSTAYRYNPTDGWFETILSDGFIALKAAGLLKTTGNFTSLVEVGDGFSVVGITSMPIILSGF